jgi:Ca2+-binding EF-hand superfamily protein
MENIMQNVLKYALIAGALAFVPASAHAAMTPEQCSEMLKKADTNGDGSLAGEEAVRFQEAMTKMSLTTKDASIVTMDEFMAACEKGTFDGM